MKKLISYSGKDKQRRLENEAIKPLKIMNFEPKIQAKTSPSKTRYSNEQKIMRRREIVQTYNSHIYREHPKTTEERRAQSSSDLRIENELFGEFHKADLLNEEMGNLSPALKEKIAELRNLATRKSALSKRQEQRETQMIHFTEYVMHSDYPNASVLHSRGKRDLFMKSVKARHILNRSTQGRSKSQTDQLFKSIQLNNCSKYAVSKRIMLSGDSFNNGHKEAKAHRAEYGSKGYLQQRRRRMRKGHKAVKLDHLEQCKPWQTSAFEHGEDDHSIFHH